MPEPDVLTNVVRRLRMLEESHANVRKKIELEQENNLNEIKKLHANSRDSFSEIDALKKEIRLLKEDLRKIIQELQQTAKQDKVLFLEKYLQLWEPVKFVTKREVIGLIKEELSQLTPQNIEQLTANSDSNDENEIDKSNTPVESKTKKDFAKKIVDAPVEFADDFDETITHPIMNHSVMDEVSKELQKKQTNTTSSSQQSIKKKNSNKLDELL
jgi:hypothetical protein